MDMYTITKNQLKQILRSSANALVGKSCKRFEILENKNDIKKDVKELIYENSREIEKLIESFSNGINFISKPKTED